ncbi:hypothetical protein [Micromonospora sp. NPDC050200]|uniref:hypothetical protein n=1 Tax=Micromonospora sp. NPDC050200 TaxID=3155664 RepID=UPI0033D6787D
MADPLWINASGGAPAYSANEMRQAMALALMYGGRTLGARQGVRPGGTQLQVSLAGSTITVQPGVACIDPGLTSPQGPYWVAIPVAETHTLAAADATNPRKDIIQLRVYDHDEDLSGLRLARTEYKVGVAGPTPAEPGVDAGAFRLAMFDVPRSGGGAAAVTDRRPFTVASGGTLPVRSEAERDALAAHPGMRVFRLDVDREEVYHGNGRWWEATPLFVYKPSTTARTSQTAVADDPHLTLPAQANAIYLMECVLGVDGAAAGDLKVAWSVPAGAFMNRATDGPAPSATDRDNLTVTRRINGSATELTYGLVGAGAATNVEERAVLVTSGTAGSVTLRWAQATSSTTATQLTANNAFLTLTRVG